MCHHNNNYFVVLLDKSYLPVRQVDPIRFLVKSAQLGFRSSQESNINREAPPSFSSHFTQASSLEREEEVRQRERRSYLGVLHCLGWVLYWGSFAGFSPLWFPQVKYLCSLCCCACYCFSDPTIVNFFRISSKQLRKFNMVLGPPWKETLCI